jgi:hypothetical protein
MKRTPMMLIPFFAVLSFILTANLDAGGTKASAWKMFLPDDAYKVLTERSIRAIEDAAKSTEKNAVDRAEVEAAILAGYTLSAKNPKDEAVSTLRGAALQASAAARKNDLKKLSDFKKSITTAPKAPAEIKDIKLYLHATEPMMKGFLSKAKGGEGIHAELMYQPKLKNLNGVEALIGALATKKISDDNLAKVTKELPLLAYRVAVMGSLTYEFTPAKDAEKWREYSAAMRDSSITLADATNKKSAAGVMKAALALESSCIDCHSVFKNN